MPQSSTPTSVYEQVLDQSNRANPYPLYAELRKTPVARQDDGSYVVSTYREIVALLHDPRVSSDRLSGPDVGRPGEDERSGEPPTSFIHLDPPAHDRSRRAVMRHFGPPETPGRIEGMRGRITEIVTTLIDGFEGRDQVDIVHDFAYPLPVTVICSLLGVPREDEPRFSKWADALIETLDPRTEDPERLLATTQREMSSYLNDVIESSLANQGDDLLSTLAADDPTCGGLSRQELLANAILLFVAGHETTVNLITNGMLTLLRHPDTLNRLREEPELIDPLVEELLRYEPPVHFALRRIALTDIDIAGTTIPQGASIVLALAAGNRDPDRFDNPDRFDPDRPDNEHLGFNSGIHYCFGAPLARLETQLALTELVHRLRNPRLLTDPPPYRPNPRLRGPSHLPVAFDGVAPSS
ncbi:cytochrome P450 [Nonomuraea sp. NEAU-A123]|uniref:cytochrome P450 n=1 Tax=Nonomuraea sp. NEAU-A123 TaxID=2839649 RepID=UPI001BE406D5|nr:cytochrome P450 [Nonomuraea sp. NEAU-A123]MBT2234477.1 cytochrome P450 [Nonomuraea sp. NEAU-A123]